MKNENEAIMQATTKIILDKRRMKMKNRTFPVKLSVTYHRKTKLYTTNFSLTQTDFEKLSAPRIGEDLQKIKRSIKSIQQSSQAFLDEQDTFNFNDFEKEYINNNTYFKKKKIKKEEQQSTPDSFDFSPYYRRFPLFQEDHTKPGSISIVYLFYIKLLLQEERIGTALSYQQSYNSIKTFRGNPLFTDITVSFLNQFEKWMLNRGCSRTTVGIKIRPLRTMFNEAIEMGIIKREKNYPFGRRKYRIPTGRNLKKALDQHQIASIYYYQTLCALQKKARDFWLFSYFGNGMNTKDVAYLKYKDIQEGYLIFIRAKTERATRNDPKPITVFINEDMWRIIEQWGNKPKDPNGFIFPIINPRETLLKQYEQVTSFNQFINDQMEKIRQALGIDKRVTTIVSRHTFSTQLKRSGASTEYIQEALGHTDKKTTENYLDSFANDIKRHYAGLLSSFKHSTQHENVGD